MSETPDFLADYKIESLARLVSHLDGVGSSVTRSYPMAERESWPTQKPEAEAAIALGEEAFKALTLAEATAITPFLLKVTVAHKGPVEDDETRVAQLWDKSVAVKANADNWAELAAYVNGLRARVQDNIEIAATEPEVYGVIQAAFTELEQWRAVAGV